jgi:hypothetical protein
VHKNLASFSSLVIPSGYHQKDKGKNMSRQTECVSKEKWRNKYVGYLSVLLEGCGLYLNRVPV